MKTGNYLLAAFILALWAAPAGATIWRVNIDPSADADFTDLQSANNAAVNGDTIYVEGGNYIASGLDVTFSRRLYIVGPGYFLNENPETQVNTQVAQLRTITFSPGSEGSVMTGCYADYDVLVYADSISLRGNFIDNYLYIGDNTNAIKDVLVSQNYFDSHLRVRRYATNITIRNNYFVGDFYGPNDGSSQVTIYNNVFGTSSDIYDVFNSVLNNNIMVGTATIFELNSGNLYSNNLAAGTQFGTDNDNLVNVVMANVFVGSGTTDDQWQLAVGSAAIGAGINGEDCGMFGGTTPYILSGIIDIPSIYLFSTTGPGTTEGGLNVRIRAKSH